MNGESTLEQQKKYPLRLEDIEEFTQLRLPSREEITDEIRAGVRKLDEKTELEPFLRDLLPDETNTPHTSTEIADILTTHVTYQGKPCLAAFIPSSASPVAIFREIFAAAGNTWAERPEHYVSFRRLFA